MRFLQITQRSSLLIFNRVMVLALLAFGPQLNAQAAVSIDQSPLILQNPLPPNIVLMLDDSGSMGWDYMPDWGYLTSTTGSGPVNSSVNSIYYNPAVTYTPPVHADGTSYTNQTDITKVPVDGFDATSDLVDLTNYNGNYDTRKIDYSSSTSYDTIYSNVSSGSACTTLKNDTGGSSSYYSRWSKNCTVTYSVGFFQYSTGAAAGPYTVHYVANTSCGTQSNCVTSTDDSGAAAPKGIAAGTNIANWFAYYHTRILTTKTGLTLAFSTLDPSYRLGFGSINNSGATWIKDNVPYVDKSGRRIAEVAKFGDGTNGTQKANFWTWITDEVNAYGGTPLRKSLKAVGEYYQTAQPWQSTDANNTVQEYACRPSYTILTTDGFWNGDSPSVGNADNTNGTKITEPSDYQYKPIAPFMDSYSDTLADVAMTYWETDLRPSTKNEVPTTPDDPAFWQHMTTFTMGLGWDPEPYLKKGSGDETLTLPQIFDWARTGTAPTGFSNTDNIWPKPAADDINNIADLAHAAVNGHGDFFSVKTPDELIDGLKSALKKIGEQPGAGNAVTLSDTTLPADSTKADAIFRFRGTYYTGQWSGVLTAEKYDTTTTQPSYTPFWTSNDLTPSFSTVNTERLSNRNVWTSKPGNGNKTTSVAFRQASDLSATQQTDLGAYSVSTVSAQTMINYLLGDNTYAQGSTGGTLRKRDSFLGDIVSSTPVLVAAPNADLYASATFTGAKEYSTFVKNEASRAPLVYVAANDGMLHAFRVTEGAGYARDGSSVSSISDQAAGTEVYAYMPAAVLTQTGDGSITNLANPEYGVVDKVSGTQPVPHQYYNDGRITVQNVYFNNAWHTVLVGTTGRGPAKALYALDITDPSVLMNPATAENALLWERSAGDGKSGSEYIGEMVGAPVIAQVKDGNKTSWAVFIGNGYNSNKDSAALLQFDLESGDLTVHKTDDSVTSNGLAEPGLMQPDKTSGVSTFAFAGDLKGHLWKFDLSNASSTGSVAFNAQDSNGKAQPITSLVSLAYDGATDSTFALFGTGKYLATNDTNDDQVQTWYGVRVGKGADLSGTSSPITPVVDDATPRSDLVERYAFDDSSGNRATSTQSSEIDMNDKAGWFMDLPQNGERIVNRTQFIGGKAVVTTLIPKVNDPCNTVPAGAVMGVDPFTGANQEKDYGLGATTISFKDANGNTVTKTVAINGKVFTAGPSAGVTAVTNADGSIFITFNTMSSGLASLPPLNLGGAQAERLSWRELSN